MRKLPGLTLHLVSALLFFAACSASEESATNAHGGSGGSAASDGGGQGGSGGSCEPLTCETAGAECGVVSDGCGQTLSCGGCDTGEVCGGGGPNLCGTNPCTPKTCGQLGAACGVISDGCGNVLDCGSCPTGLVCGNAQVTFQCVSVDGGTGGTAGTGGTGGGGSGCTPGEPCDDGNACTQNDTCNSSGQCEGGAAVTCTSPPNGCFVSTGVCDSLSGSCSYPYQASGIPCPDDGNACTIDQCDGAGQCGHVAKAPGTPCGSGTCSGGVCVASCQGGGNVTWSQTHTAWYGNPSTAGTYLCAATLPTGSFVHGTAVQVTTNAPQKREGAATATCSSGIWQVSGSCDGKVVDTLINTECTASSPATRQMIAGWYVADLYRCADSAGLDYWVSQYENPSPTVCTPASNYGGTGSKETCWRAVFRDSANAVQSCYDQAQASGHICDGAVDNFCAPDSHYPWASIVSAGTTCKFGP